MRRLLNYFKGDVGIWVIVLILMGTSVLTVYSFVPILVKTEGGTPFGYTFKHVIYIALGVIAMNWIHKRDPIYIQRLSKFIFVVSIALLIFTFFFGVRVNDASRWVRVPVIGLTFQSSDFAKFALIIFIARRLVVKKADFDSWQKSLLSFGLPIFIICGFIAKDNFSTAVLLFVVCILILFVAKFPFSSMMAIFGAGAVAVGITVLLHLALPSANILPRFDTWMSRFSKAYTENVASVENMQAINAQLAIYNGGYTGVGVGQGELKHYTPQAYADFYYSSLVEEFGVFFSSFIIFLYLVLFYRILRIALQAKDLFETYFAIGVGLMFLFQTMINVFVCTGIMPVTGQIIPFLGMGGSGMIMNSIALGMVQAIAYKNQKKEEGSNVITQLA